MKFHLFQCEDFMDDKIDVGFRHIFNSLMLNEQFKTYIVELRNTFSPPDEEKNDDMNYFTFLSLFDMKIFYLTHQFISHYLLTNEIETTLFEQIKQLNTIFSEK